MTIAEIAKEQKTKFLSNENMDEEFDKLNDKTELKDVKLFKLKTPIDEHTYENEDYKVTIEGVFYKPNSTDKEPSPTPVCICSAIYPVAYLADFKGSSHGLLIKIYHERFTGGSLLIPIPRTMIGKAHLMKDFMLDNGQWISPEGKHLTLLENFLQKVKPEKQMKSVYKAGWHGNQYVFPDGDVKGNIKNGENCYPMIQFCPEGFETKGSLKEWQDNLLPLCKGNSRMIFSLAIALAGPCAELVKEDSGGFNFKGRSSCGKTTCLLTAVSVCGSPKFKKSWKSTSNAIEGICFLHNDNLLALDEFGQVDSKEAGNTAYMIAQGMGKNRLNSDSTQQMIKTWRSMVISTGEVGLAEHMQEKGLKTKAGQLVRFCDIPAEVEKGYGCFESIHGCCNGSDFATIIKVACESYYGTPIREFVNVLIQEKDISTQFLKHAMEDFAADISRDFDGQVKRVARRFGLLYGAIWLAVKKDLLGSYLTEEDAKWAITVCFESWLNDRGTTGSFESKSIIEKVIRLIRENSDSKFPDVNWKENSECRPTYAQIWGRKKGDIYYISCETFNKHFCEGENPKTVIKTLEEEGVIIRSENGKISSAKRLLSGESKQVAKFYTLKISTMFTN